jgi:hypothetical protein
MLLTETLLPTGQLHLHTQTQDVIIDCVFDIPQIKLALVHGGLAEPLRVGVCDRLDKKHQKEHPQEQRANTCACRAVGVSLVEVKPCAEFTCGKTTEARGETFSAIRGIAAVAGLSEGYFPDFHY